MKIKEYFTDSEKELRNLLISNKILIKKGLMINENKLSETEKLKILAKKGIIKTGQGILKLSNKGLKKLLGD